MLVNLCVGGGKWMSVQSSLNLLVGVKPGDVRIGPLVVSGLIAGWDQELVPKTSRFQVCFCCFWCGMVGYCCGFYMRLKEIVNECLILSFCSYWCGMGRILLRTAHTLRGNCKQVSDLWSCSVHSDSSLHLIFCFVAVD